MAKKAAKLNPAERMLRGKRQHIERLKDQIAGIRADAEEDIQKIQKRIRIFQVIVDALEAGTLKP